MKVTPFCRRKESFDGTPEENTAVMLRWLETLIPSFKLMGEYKMTFHKHLGYYDPTDNLMVRPIAEYIQAYKNVKQWAKKAREMWNRSASEEWVDMDALYKAMCPEHLGDGTHPGYYQDCPICFMLHPRQWGKFFAVYRPPNGHTYTYRAAVLNDLCANVPGTIKRLTEDSKKTPVKVVSL